MNKDLEKKDHGSHYRKEFKGIKLDPARIAQIYQITHSMQFSIFKKSLRAGAGHKSLEQDIKDMKCACERWLEMIEEDKEEGASK